jgi:HEAT repeat protein
MASGVLDSTGLVARVKAASSDRAMDEILSALSIDQRAASLLAELVSFPDPIVRAWVAFAARRVLRREEAIRLVSSLARDRDSNVRDSAVEELFELRPEPAVLAPLLKALRRRFLSKNFLEADFAVWRLAGLRDPAAIPSIERYARDSKYPYKAKSAEIALMLPNKDDELILELIRAHDHDRMFWLARAAGLIRTMEALEALEANAGEMDEQCARDCAFFAQRVRMDLSLPERADAE